MSNPTTPIPIMEFYEGMHMKHFVLYPDSITIVRAEGYRKTARSDQSKCRVCGETIAKGDERMAYRVPLSFTQRGV